MKQLNGSLFGNNGQRVTVIIDGRPYTAEKKSNANFDAIVAELRKTSPNGDTLYQLVDTAAGVKDAISVTAASRTGRVSFSAGALKYNGVALHNYVVDKLVECVRNGVPLTPLLNFVEKLMQNPSKRAVDELYKFLEHKNMPLTPDGNFLAYKSVQKDGWSATGNPQTIVLQGKTDAQGRIFNVVGGTIEVARNSVDDNKDHGCSNGLHAGSFEYANSFVRDGKFFLVEIDPKDVVSVPLDCNCQKLRTCKYKVVREITNDRVANSAAVVSSSAAATPMKNSKDYQKGYDAGYGDSYEGYDDARAEFVGDYQKGYIDGFTAAEAR